MTHPISHHHSRELTSNWKSLKKRSLIDVLVRERERERDLIDQVICFCLFGNHFVKINCFFPLESRCNFHAYVTCTIGWGPCGMKWRSLIRISHSVPIGIKRFIIIMLMHLKWRTWLETLKCTIKSYTCMWQSNWLYKSCSKVEVIVEWRTSVGLSYTISMAICIDWTTNSKELDWVLSAFERVFMVAKKCVTKCLTWASVLTASMNDDDFCV